jgi:hypothetical protein
MLKKQSFVKKTRAGKVVKVVREHYLRDDISCGSRACDRCEHLTPPILSTKQEGAAKGCDALYSDADNQQQQQQQQQQEQADTANGTADINVEQETLIHEEDIDDMVTTSVGEYVILDTNVVLHQIDLLEHAVRHLPHPPHASSDVFAAIVLCYW